jgi:hypothetical protein
MKYVKGEFNEIRILDETIGLLSGTPDFPVFGI